MSTNDHAQLINRNEPNQHMAKAIVYGGEPLNKQLDAMKATIAERPTTDEVADGYYNKGEVDSQLAGKAGTDHGELLNRDAANQHMATAISYNGAPLDAQLDTMTADIALRPTTAEVADGYYGKSEIDAQMAEKAGTDHNQLSNRDAADQHPAAAITYNGAALDTELDQVRADVTQRPTATEVADNHYSKSEVDTRMANKAGTEAVTLSANGLATPEIQSLVEYGDLALTVVQPVESQPGEITVTCGKIVDGRRYMLTFITPKPFDTADTLVVNGTPTTIRMADGSAPTTGLFASGAQKTAALDTTVAGHYILTFEAGAAVGTYDAVCVTTGARHELTIASFPASLPPTFTVRVTMDANYLAGNTFHIGGTEFAARTQTNDAAPNDVVKAGATIEIVFDTSRGLAFFKAGVGRNGWNISVGGETPVSEGIHVPDAVAPSRVYLDNGFERYSPDIKQVAVGWSHTLILLNSGRVLSCGNNNSGQLGRSTPSGGEMTINLDYIPGLDDVVAIAANYSQSFFIRSNGSGWSCGNNYYGQLGRIIPTGDVSTVNLGGHTRFNRRGASSRRSVSHSFSPSGRKGHILW
ncbi:MAG: hypothetical protein LIQ31_09670 [Planctomycetes bacterium]|nr:hypothetical protein [Planctomycetota bacterium]